jgi:hypothetical protein
MSVLDWVLLVSTILAMGATLRYGLLGFVVGIVGVWASRSGYDLWDQFDSWEGASFYIHWDYAGAFIAAAACLPILVGRFIVGAMRRKQGTQGRS